MAELVIIHLQMRYTLYIVKIRPYFGGTMLTFEQKLNVIAAIADLQRKNVSMGRVNYHYEASIIDKKIIVYHLHPNGNGFVYAEHIPHIATDEKGFVNIRDYTADQLHSIIEAAIVSVSVNGGTPIKAEKPPMEASVKLNEESWTDDEGQVLILIEEDDLWNVYTGGNLEMAFETYMEAKQYLKEEGFRRS